MVENEHNFIVEIAQFMGGIDKVLENIQQVLNTIPKITENEKVINSILDIKNNINSLKELFESYSEKSKQCSEDITILIETLDSKINKLINVSEIKDCESYKLHVKQINDLYDNIYTVNILGQIKNIGIMADELKQEIKNFEIKYGYKLSAEDIQSVVKMSKTFNKTYDSFTKKKKIIMAAIAIILTLLLFSDKIISIGNYLETQKAGVQQEQIIGNQ